MKPIKTPMTNKMLGKPETWDDSFGECVTLPVHVTEDMCFSWWRATIWERLLILFGRPIRLCIVSSWIPPVAIDAKK